jgi:hypothetical protein
MEASTLIDPRVVDAATTVVPVVAHGPLEHGTFEAIENGRPVTRCRLYRNLECAEHQATHDALFPYQPKGRFRIPFTVWIDPEGKQIFRRDGWRRPDEFLYDIRLALEKVKGPRRSKADYLSLVKPLDDGLAALAVQDFHAAAVNLEKARGADVPEIRDPAEAGLQQIESTAEKILAKAKSALKAGRTPHARQGLDFAARQFPTLETGKEALKLMQELPFPLKELTLRRIDENGGVAVHVRGDGNGIARFVTRAEGSAVLREKRFGFALTQEGEWSDLTKLANPPLQEKSPQGTVTVELWNGKRATGAWAGLHAWLMARAEDAAKRRPLMEGDYDPAWAPK